MSKQVCDLIFKGRRVLKILTFEVEDYVLLRNPWIPLPVVVASYHTALPM